MADVRTSLGVYPKLSAEILAFVALATQYLTHLPSPLRYVGAVKVGFAVCTAKHFSGYRSANARQMLKPLEQSQLVNSIHLFQSLETEKKKLEQRSRVKIEKNDIPAHPMTYKTLCIP